MRHLIEAIAAIDDANAEDPNDHNGEPRALVQGRRASYWLSKLHPNAGDELQLAARSHHLRRWEVARSDFETGRSGYLLWRRTNKQHQAAQIAAILEPLGWGSDAIERVQALLLRKRLSTDPETQAVEDVACLVFVETQFDELNDRLDHDHMVNVVVKTLKKMSAQAIDLAAAQPLSAAAQKVLADAVEQLNQPQAVAS